MRTASVPCVAMAPAAQTVVAVLLVVGLAGGPSEVGRSPGGPADSTAPVQPAPEDKPKATDAGGTAEAEPQPANGTPAEPAEQEANPGPPEGESPSDTLPPADAPQTAGSEPMPSADVPEPEPVEPRQDDVSDGGAPEDESWEDESWEDESWEDDYDPLRDSPEAVAAQRRIAGGAVVVGLGAMVSLGGLAMAVSDPCARPAGNSCSSASRNRAALTMALPGLATVAVGSVMLALGIRQRKALRVDASLTASGGGLVFRGRF